jgi:lipopolysaccharide biosynthesis regulator YciM
MTTVKIVYEKYTYEYRINSLKVKENAGYKCQLCGTKAREYKPLLAHHKDDSVVDHSVANLLAVCRECHSALHRTKYICPDYNCKHWKLFVGMIKVGKLQIPKKGGKR